MCAFRISTVPCQPKYQTQKIVRKGGPELKRKGEEQPPKGRKTAPKDCELYKRLVKETKITSEILSKQIRLTTVYREIPKKSIG